MDPELRARLPHPERATRFWWIRHARVPEVGTHMYGSLDVDCDTSNEALFAGVAARLPDDALWVTSPLRRTRQTADALVAAGARAGEWREEADIAELDFGDYNGIALTELLALRDDPFLGFWPLSPHERAPNGESFTMLADRVRRFVRTMQHERRGRDVVCVAHRGTILAALQIALELPVTTSVAFDIDNVSLTRLVHHADVPEGGPFYRVAEVGWLPHGREAARPARDAHAGSPDGR